MRMVRVRYFAIGCCVLCVTGFLPVQALSSAVAAGRNQALPTAELLLDLARDHGLSCKGKQTVADVQHIETLLRAATRLNPRLADAYVWLHELAVLRGDERAAAEMVRQLVAADTTHAGAMALWLEVGAQASQTIEKRIAWLNAQLQSAENQPGLQAVIHVQLSRLAAARMEPDAAREHVDRALSLDPWNPEAAALHIELLGGDATAAERVRAVLRFLQLSPFDVQTAWLVGTLLDEHGFHEQADEFYEHALQVQRDTNPRAPVPAVYLLQLAHHALARGKLDQAAQHITAAVTADRGLAGEAGMLLHWLLTRQGRTADADAVRKQLTQRFAEVREPREWPVNDVAQAAWFYCRIGEQPQRALMLAQAAAARAPHDPFVQRVLGWAQAANLQPEWAERTLRPIADSDPYAAYKVAQVLTDAGDEEGARRVVGELTAMPPAGPARELLSEFGLPPTATQPADQRHPRVAAALAEFPSEVLEFGREPARFLEAGVTVEDRSPSPGEPWRAVFTLTNRARFPITLGPGWIVNPVFLLSFELEGDRKREYSDLLTINLDRVRVIPPGATVRIRRTIDLGPLRRVSRMTPQHVQRVTLRAILDPLRGPDGVWRPAVSGQRLRPTYFNRLPASTSREALHGLFSDLTGTSARARFRTVEVLAELFGESQRAALKRLHYRPGPVPNKRIKQALLAALSGESWELRVRTLDALQVAGLDAALLEAVQGCLEHRHWLVRLMAVRLLGSRQGSAAAPKLRVLAQGDADELVRALASSYLTTWDLVAATTQPSAPRRASSARGADRN